MRSKGECAFDQLHCLLEGNIRSRRHKQVHVVWHEHECVQQVFFSLAVMPEDFDE